MTDQPADQPGAQALAHVTLRDGSRAWVRPLRPDDREELADEYEHLSPQSRRLRFMASVPRLTPAMLTRLVDEVDGVEPVSYTHLDVYKRQADKPYKGARPCRRSRDRRRGGP